MQVSTVPRIAGALLFRPQPHVDERGFFSRTFDADVARAAGIDPAGFAQDSLSGRPAASSGACTSAAAAVSRSWSAAPTGRCST